MEKQEYWNQSTEKYGAYRVRSKYAHRCEKDFPRGSMICELGGGSGGDSLYFLEMGHRIELFDISTLGISRVQKKVKMGGFEDSFLSHCVDLSDADLSIADESMDVIYSRLALHYFSLEKTIEIMREVARVLRVGGRGYIAVKSSNDVDEINLLSKNVIEIEKNVYEDEGFVKSRFDKGQWGEIMRRAGILDFEVRNYVGEIDGQRDGDKSRNKQLELIEIVFCK